MALAEISDIEARLGHTLTADELLRAPGLLDEASALVEGYCGRTFPIPPATDVPSAVVVVVSKLAARGLSTAGDVADVSANQYTAGPFQWQQSFAGDGSRMWIGSAEKLMLKPYRISMRSIPLVSERDNTVAVEEEF